MRLAITLQNQSYLADCAYRLVGVSDLTSSVMAGRIFVWKQWGTKIKGRSWIWQLSLPHNFTMLLRICLYLRFRYLFYMTCPLKWLTLIIFQISHVCHVGPRAWCSQGLLSWVGSKGGLLEWQVEIPTAAVLCSRECCLKLFFACRQQCLWPITKELNNMSVGV